jgi:hypothetical protein
MNAETAREIVKLSLRKYHGDIYDKTINNFDILRNDFRGKMCFYQHEPVKIYPNGFTWRSQYLIMSIEPNNIIKLNPNLIRSRRYQLETGKKFTGMEGNIKDGYDLDCTSRGMEAFKYVKSLAIILGEFREQRINKILE